MTTKLSELPSDPLDKGESNVAPNQETNTPVKKKRTRRTKAQMAADKAAQALGFKNAADQREQSTKLEEVDGDEKKPSGDWGDTPVDDLPKPLDVPEIAGIKTGLTTSTRWNLGGHTFILTEICEDGRVIFTPCLSK